MKRSKITGLVLHCEETLDRLQAELEAFFAVRCLAQYAQNTCERLPSMKGRTSG
jgi:hypothetical protein